jgi:outer membrane protein assembly factor BamB
VIPSHGLTAIKPGGVGFEQIWNASNLSPSTSSPVALNGMTFTLNSAGVLSAGEIESGKRLWQLRLKGPFSGTPLVSNDHIFFFNESGLAFVVKPEQDKGEIISELDLTETILCSPAAADNALYVRSDGHLWKFAAAK